MEATKKTSTTKAALLVLAALSMLLSGLFIATASRSDASPPPACPDGFTLTADAKNCFQAAVITSADNPNSCDTGSLTPDGTKCYAAARLIPQAGATMCPKGYSPDDSLGGMCARFDVASQRAATCPDGARGVAGACYILVAKGPRGVSTCDVGVLVGNQCVITGDAPVYGPSTCPVSATVIKDGSACYTLVGRNALATCAAGYTYVAPLCKAVNPNAVDSAGHMTWSCASTGNGAADEVIGTGGKVLECSYTLVQPDGAGDCPAGTTPDPLGPDCRRPVDLRPGALVCDSGFGLISGKCIRYAGSDNASPQCPIGSVEDGSGDCRKPVADAKGAYYCKDANAALNGKSCVWTSGFLINPTPDLYKCDAGVRTVIGFGAGTKVICILGNANANTTTGPSCLQGVLSTDNAYCIVPRIDTAPAAVTAPVPSFTG